MLAATIFLRYARISCRHSWMLASFTCSGVTFWSLGAGVGVGCCAASSDVAKASANVGGQDAKKMLFLTSGDGVTAMFVLLMHPAGMSMS